jgi:hypothetical protein
LAKSSGLFDYILINKQLEITTEKLQDLISANRPDLIPPRSEVRGSSAFLRCQQAPLFPPSFLSFGENQFALAALLLVSAGGHLSGALSGGLGSPRLGLQGNHGPHGHRHVRLCEPRCTAAWAQQPCLTGFAVCLRGTRGPGNASDRCDAASSGRGGCQRGCPEAQGGRGGGRPLHVPEQSRRIQEDARKGRDRRRLQGDSPASVPGCSRNFELREGKEVISFCAIGH